MRTLISETPQKIGEEVTIKGWVGTKRDHGKLTFIDLRDRTGIVQCVGFEKMGELTTESVISITGMVKARPERMVNANLPTGTIEIDVIAYEVLNKANELPMHLDSDGREINEETRLRYRYLDMRRERMAKNLLLRSDYTAALRDELKKHTFTEVETPLLTKSTKEGARDFIVPSRFQPGKFYALPQSPQQYKQLLMVGGVERYFQFARCIRDEDLRADRGFEFTQLDMEMGFVTREESMEMIESIIKNATKRVGGKIQNETFPIFTYKEAMEKYGADKFDMRTTEEKENNVLAFAWVINFPFFRPVSKDEASDTYDSKSQWTFTHNPFSMPLPEHLEWHMNGENIDQIMTTQYDLVCNGYEIGGGSIRAHTPEILKATYKIMGYSDQEIEDSVGHMLEAFSYGAPPHGGIGLGFDRQVMILAGEESLKEVIPFPMSSTGRTSVMDAPSLLPEVQLKELGLQLVHDSKK